MTFHETPWWLQTEVTKLRGYTVTDTPHGLIIWGAVPLSAMSALMNQFIQDYPGAVIDLGLQNYYQQCTMVICKDQDAADQWRKEVNDELDRLYGKVASEYRWLKGLDTGLSSKCIWHYMMGTTQSLEKDLPHDAGDFGRCYRLLEIKPEWRERLKEMGKDYPTWQPLISHWEELETAYVEKRYQQLTERIQELLVK